jgi:hypothetical protein
MHGGTGNVIRKRQSEICEFSGASVSPTPSARHIFVTPKKIKNKKLQAISNGV